MSQENIKNIIEAALMVSTQALNISSLLALFENDQTLQAERNDISTAIEELQQDYHGRGIELTEVASGFRFQARNEYAAWVNRLFTERPPRYSRALLETLVIIAYRQPITRSEIEEIRGVSVSSTIVKTLQERDWIKVIGHRDVPGKPALLTTTKSFLDYFNLKKLSDLPTLADIKDFDSINPDLFEGLESNVKADAEKTELSEEVLTVDAVNGDTLSNDKISVENEIIGQGDTTKSADVAEEHQEEIIEEAIEQEGARVIPFSS